MRFKHIGGDWKPVCRGEELIKDCSNRLTRLLDHVWDRACLGSGMSDRLAPVTLK